MALTPFVADTPTTPDESGSTFDSIKSQWNSFLSKPEGQAALLSFGINLMQPPSFGDNPLAQTGRAIGHAGQTVGNIEAMDIKKQEAASKEDLRAAQADKAALGSVAQGQAAQTAQAKLGLAQLGLQLQSAKAIHGAYGAYVKAWQAQKNASILDPKMDPGPQKSLEEYTAANPTLAGLAQHSGLFGGGGASSGGGSSDAEALAWANANPGDPRAAQIKARLGE